MSIRLEKTSFTFRDGMDEVFVNFDESTKQVEVIYVHSGAIKVKVFSNAGREYKPCATHAMEMIERALGMKAKTGFESHRRKASKSSRVPMKRLGVFRP